MKVLISILNWNAADETISCCKSVLAQGYSDFDVVVVDNASGDDSVERIRCLCSDIMVIESGDNLGFAMGHNLSVSYALQKGEYDLIWLLNNDSLVAPDSLQHLVVAYQKYGDALYGSVTLKGGTKDLVEFAGIPLVTGMENWRKREPNRFMDRPYEVMLFHLGSAPVEVNSVHGCSMLIPLSVIRQYGFMDERFFLYCEETDYCYRLRKNGITSVIVPQSIVRHQMQASTRRSPAMNAIFHYYLERNSSYIANAYFAGASWSDQLRWHGGLIRYIVRVLHLRYKWTLLNARNRSCEEMEAVYAEFYQEYGWLDMVLDNWGRSLQPEDYLNVPDCQKIVSWSTVLNKCVGFVRKLLRVKIQGLL